MRRLYRIALHLLAILILLVCAGAIVMLIHFAIYGNPIKDSENIINGVKGFVG